MRCSSSLLSLLVFLIATTGVQAANLPGAIELTPGFKYVPLQGIDSFVGKIVHADGREITFEIGRVTPPGKPAFGGDFSDRAARLQQNNKDDLSWSGKQVIGGEPVHLALMKNGRLVVSFPSSGANFSTEAKTPNQLADALLIILSYPGGK